MAVFQGAKMCFDEISLMHVCSDYSYKIFKISLTMYLMIAGPHLTQALATLNTLKSVFGASEIAVSIN